MKRVVVVVVVVVVVCLDLALLAGIGIFVYISVFDQSELIIQSTMCSDILRSTEKESSSNIV